MGYCSVYIYWGCSFLDSNLLQTLIVFITGLFVIIIYALQKRNEKQKITKLLLSEIYLAEKTIANLLSQ